MLVTQLCLTLWDPMDLPARHSVHGILQERVLEWVAIVFSREFSPTQGANLGLMYCRQILYHMKFTGNMQNVGKMIKLK